MTDEQQIRHMEEEWINAFARSDIDTLRNILADDFVFTDPYGLLKTKDEWLLELANGDLSVESLSIDDLSITVSGNIATANAYLTLKAKSREGGYHGQFHSVDVYEKRDGRWQAIVSGAKRASA